MTKPFDPTKPVQTRAGRKARILCTDLVNYQSPYRIVAAVLDQDGKHESIITYTPDGRYVDQGHPDDPRNLINAPVVRHEFVNVLEGTPGFSGHLNFTYTDENKARNAIGPYHRYVGTIIKRYEDEKLVSTTFVKWETKD